MGQGVAAASIAMQLVTHDPGSGQPGTAAAATASPMQLLNFDPGRFPEDIQQAVAHTSQTRCVLALIYCPMHGLFRC